VHSFRHEDPRLLSPITINSELKVNRYRRHSGIYYISTDFVVESSCLFPGRAQTDGQTDATKRTAPHQIHGSSLGPHECAPSNGILIGSSVFAGLSDLPYTDKQTEHGMCDMCSICAMLRTANQSAFGEVTAAKGRMASVRIRSGFVHCRTPSTW